MSTSRTAPRGGSYERPYFSPEELHETLDYLASLVPADTDPVHWQRLAHLRQAVDEQSLMAGLIPDARRPREGRAVRHRRDGG